MVGQRYDRRLTLLSNTLASPASDASGASALLVCPTAPKTFVNRGTCVAAAACAPTVYTSARFTLSGSMDGTRTTGAQSLPRTLATMACASL